jgi:hypothetical protein
MVAVINNIDTYSHRVLTISEIQQEFPDEWVLLGNPVFENAKLMFGNLIAHGKDYLELCYQSKELAIDYTQSTIIFTGENKTQNRKWLRSILSAKRS